ncbi:hypothetical protein DsansV1_C29g0208491 [Dioscorea sansibarensis]
MAATAILTSAAADLSAAAALGPKMMGKAEELGDIAEPGPAAAPSPAGGRKIPLAIGTATSSFWFFWQCADVVRGEMEWITHRESHRSGSGGAGTSKSRHVCWMVVVLPMSPDLPLCTDN